MGGVAKIAGSMRASQVSRRTDSRRPKFRRITGVSPRPCRRVEGRFEGAETYRFGEFFQSDKPLLKFSPRFAWRQIDFQYPRIRSKTDPSPVRWKIDRQISLPMNRAPVSDGRRDDDEPASPIVPSKGGKKDDQVPFSTRFEDERSLGRVVRQQIQRKTKPSRPFDL